MKYRPALSLILLSGFLLTACTEEGDTFVTNPAEPGGGTPPPPGIDSDGDGLSDLEEFTGWEIAVDFTGLGPDSLTVYRVTSDPDSRDTDGDGLDDLAEFQLRIDPRSPDTDGDRLTDHEELDVWTTKPASVDTDGDARGPSGGATPNPLLFDGSEIRLLCDGDDPGGICRHPGTSPTLADTDGDGRTDFEEFDDPSRSPLVAEVAEPLVTFVGETTVRLDVDYEESLGSIEQYGETFTRSSESFSSTTTQATASITSKLGAEYIVGAPTATVKGEVTAFAEVVNTQTSSFKNTSTEASSRYQTDSITRTESTASGFITQPLRIRNAGLTTFTISELALTALQWKPNLRSSKDPGEEVDGSFATLATLVPEVANITLAPGETSPILSVEAQEVDASLIKELLAQPTSLQFSRSIIEIEDANGLNFDFLAENTFTRTAEIFIDFGDGETELYRVATNAQRGPGGTYPGIRMGAILGEVLGVDYATELVSYERDDVIVEKVALTRIRHAANAEGTGELPAAAWGVITTTEEQAADDVGFDDIIVRAGERILLVFTQDADQDGLFAYEENLYGTSDSPGSEDTDQDGVDDRTEVRESWTVTVIDPGLNPAPYLVRSDPTLKDTDGDGLDDFQERALGTDPKKPDTDGDGLTDQVELQNGLPPLVRAPRLYVNQSVDAMHPDYMGSGESWQDAFSEVRDALNDARTRQESPQKDDDVSEIWVASGTYTATGGGDRLVSFELVPLVGLYGGFRGGETLRAQRNSDSLLNGTVLSGDLLGDDDEAGTNEENSFHVLMSGETIDRHTEIDGFRVEAGYATDDRGGAGMLLRGGSSPTVRNMIFRENHTGIVFTPSGNRGGAVRVENSTLSPGPLFDMCVFVENTGLEGGAIAVEGPCVFQDCDFSDNRADRRGGAVFVGADPDVEVSFLRCVLRRNFGRLGGGAAYVDLARVLFDRCRLQQNQANEFDKGAGGGLEATDAHVVLVQTVVWGNRGIAGSGIFLVDTDFELVNCTVAGNFRHGVTSVRSTGVIHNSVLWGNRNRAISEGDDVDVFSGSVQVRTSCVGISDLNLQGFGNLQQDPRFGGPESGNYRLSSSSPCVDAGNHLIDFDPLIPGFQPAPAIDVDGRSRIVDGNGDGSAVIDMGSYEHPGS